MFGAASCVPCASPLPCGALSLLPPALLWPPPQLDSLVLLRACAVQTMWMASCDATGGKWSTGELQPYGPLPMYPSAQALNYGQVGEHSRRCMTEHASDLRRCPATPRSMGLGA